MSTKKLSEIFLDTKIETLALVERREEYSGVFTYIFRPTNPVPFTAGEYGHIRIPTIPEGIKNTREFSFASAPHDHELWFGIDGRSQSEYQKHLRLLEVGDTVELFKLRSHMTWVPPVPKVVMIAGGVGVTPFRSMLSDARERALPLTATLLHVAHNAFLYRDELQNLADEYLTTSRPFLLEMLSDITSRKPDAHYYIAGSPDFVATVANTLTSNGITSIESDEFKGLPIE